MTRKTYEKKCRAFWYAFRMACKELNKNALDKNYDYRETKDFLVKVAKDNKGYKNAWKECENRIINNDVNVIRRAGQIIGIK